MATFNTCPPELHSYIFRLACTDDGSTIRSLSLLSTYYNAIATPLLYHTLSISNIHTSHFHDLLQKLQKTPPHLRKINHLYLSDLSPDSDPSAQRLSDAAISSLSRLLTLAAPTLRTLAFVASAPPSSTLLIARLFRTSFPQLTDLAVSGFYPFPSSPPRMPALRRLHLHGNRNPHGLLQSGALESTCPGLTHLRVSGLAMAASFVLELEDALLDDPSPNCGDPASNYGDQASNCGDQGSNYGDPLFRAALPPKVVRVVVQAGVKPPVGTKPAMTYLKDETMMRQLARLGDVPMRGERRVVVQERAVVEIGAGDIRKEWLDRVGGGDGCW